VYTIKIAKQLISQKVNQPYKKRTHNMNLALFDFDGTITTREVLLSFISAAFKPRRLVISKIILIPVLVCYKLGIVSGETLLFSFVKMGFSGLPLAKVEATGRAFVENHLPKVLRQEAIDRINWHRSQGDRIVVVSAGLDSYLSYWCNQQQIDLICSSLEHKDGILTGSYLGNQCVGPEKSRRIREKYDLSHYPVIYAYGDTKDDLDMLGLAHRKYYQWQELLA
jgi:phosphatidylglycerophosphatase C